MSNYYLFNNKQLDKNDPNNTLLIETLYKILNLKSNFEIIDNELTKKYQEIKEKNSNITNIYSDVLEVLNESDKVKQNGKIEIYRQKKFNDKYLKDICDFQTDEKNNLGIFLKDEKEFNANFFICYEIGRIEDKIYANKASFVKDIFTIYESFCYKLMKLAIKINPKNFISDSTISFCDLENNNFKREDILQLFIDNKTKNFTKNTDLISVCSELKVKYEDLKDIKDNFNEIYYRRNILTHGDGKVSKDYLDKVSDKLTKKYIKDNKLYFDDEYIKNCYNTMIRLIIKLFYDVMSKNGLNKKFILEGADIIFGTFLYYQEWELCKYIYKQFLDMHEFDNQPQRENCRVNYLLCLKKLGELNEFNKQISKFNVTNLVDRFKVAHDCLLEKFEKINEKLERCYSGVNVDNTNFSVWAVATWPIFIDYRETKYYQEFKQKHSEDFKVITGNVIKNQGE